MLKLVKFLVIAVASLALFACSKPTETTPTATADSSTPPVAEKNLTIGASNVPHAEILEYVAPKLKEQGIKLDIKIFQDYILPNKALASGELDANFFQHTPYLNKQLADNPNYKFTNLGGVHLEPIGFYSKRHSSLTDLPDGAEIIGSNNQAERGRVLSAFVKSGLITLKDGVDPVTANLDDIQNNPKQLKFTLELEPALTPQVYLNDEADVVVINANYALGAGLDPAKEPIFVESAENNPYVNIIVARTADKDKAELATLMNELKSAAVKQFIAEKYHGTVIPVN